MPDTLIYLFIYLFIYLGCAGSSSRHVGFLAAACKLLVAARMRDLVPRPGIELGPPALGAQSLTHWTTREVPDTLLRALQMLIHLILVKI